eukprot:scaffold1787_cov159-Amphora_coffeaeformis.AAC.3
MSKSHYETLGVARNASMEEIKAAFRKLSKETHPDVAGTSANTERFKDISQAASVLTNKTKKEAYDIKLQRPLGGHWGHHHTGESTAARAARAQQGPRATTGFQMFMQTVFRPRNMVLGSIAVYTTVTTARHVLGLNPAPVQPHTQRVQAWKNPATGEWEQPAPWDPTYRRLKPRLTLVPRDEVKTRTR